MKNLFLLLTFLFAISCGGDDFKKVEALSEFRVLSVVTTTPEVVPGAGVNLQLFVSDVKGGGRIISGTTIACIDPGIAYGAKVNCDHDPSAVSDTYDIDTTTPDMTSNLFTGLAADVLSVTVPAGIWVGRNPTEQFNGVSYIVIFNFNVDGKPVTVFKRIVATSRVALNTNPTGSAILLNGVAIGAVPAKHDELKVITNTPETYEFINAEGELEIRSEDLDVAWFVTHGKFDKPKSNVDEKVEYLGDAATEPSLVVSIVRDDRGGVEIVRQFFP